MISLSNRSLLDSISTYADYLLIKSGRFIENTNMFDIRALIKSSVETFKLQAFTKKIEIEAFTDITTPKHIKADKSRL